MIVKPDNSFILNHKEIFEWAEAATHGEHLVYASAPNGSFTTRPAGFRAAYDLYEAGGVALVQRREKDRSISYIAQRNEKSMEMASIRTRWNPGRAAA